MKISHEKFTAQTEATGFRPDVLEKFALLPGLLEALGSHTILHMENLDSERLRKAFVVYGAMKRKDWRMVSTEDVKLDSSELARQLIPTLHFNTAKEQESIDQYCARLVEE